MIPLVKPTDSEAPVISALSGQPMHPINIERSVQDWLNDPTYSTDAFLRAGGLKAVAELMRENAEIPGHLGIPAGLHLYGEFLGYRTSLTADERHRVRNLWNESKAEKEPFYGDIEPYMLSAATIYEKLSVLSSVNLISQRILSERQEKDLNAQLAAIQRKHDEEILHPQKDLTERAQGSHGGVQRKLDKQQKDLKRQKEEYKTLKATYDKLIAAYRKLEVASAKLASENNRLKAEGQSTQPADADAQLPESRQL